MVIKTKKFHKSRKNSGSRKYKTMKGGNYTQNHKPKPPRVFKAIINNVEQEKKDYKSGRSKKRPPKTAASDWKKLMISSPIIGRVNNTRGFTTLTNEQRKPYTVNTSLMRAPSSIFFKLYNNHIQNAYQAIKNGENEDTVISKYLSKRQADLERDNQSRRAYKAATEQDYEHYVKTGENKFTRYPRLNLQAEMEKVLVENPNYEESYSQPFVEIQRPVIINEINL